MLIPKKNSEIRKKVCYYKICMAFLYQEAMLYFTFHRKKYIALIISSAIEPQIVIHGLLMLYIQQYLSYNMSARFISVSTRETTDRSPTQLYYMKFYQPVV